MPESSAATPETGATADVLCHGDNKKVMKALLEQRNMAGKIKMIYIDPPFFSKSTYDAVLKAGDENIRHLAYQDKWEEGLSEYLKMLTVRLMLMKDLLRDDGMIFVHLDWHVVHYAKVIMDDIYGEKNFINEIIWTYKSGGSSKKHFARKHDSILVYGKSGKYDFQPLEEKSYNRQFKPYRFKGVKEYKDEVGWYTMVNMKDVWNIDMVGRTSAERTGYATQKPEQLIERIVSCSTCEGDICADFFCGSGTLPAVAARMGRHFIACDESALAVESTANRLNRMGVSFAAYDCGGKTNRPLDPLIEISSEELAFSDKKLISIELKSVSEHRLAGMLDESERKKVRDMMRKEPLTILESWNVDFDFDGSVRRPGMIFVREKGQLQYTCQRIAATPCVVSVKVVDIFGNSGVVTQEVL